MPFLSNRRANTLFGKKVLENFFRLLNTPVTPNIHKKDKNSLRVVTYNVHFGRKLGRLAMAFAENENLKQSDIILLQEIEAFPKHGIEQAKKIAEALGFYYFYADAREVSRLGKKGTHGLAIISRFPLLDVKVISLPFLRLPLHSRKRIALFARVKVQNREIIFCNIHLDARVDCRSRISQLKGATDFIKSNYRLPLVLGGDFNTFPFHIAFKAIPVFYFNQYKKVHEFLRDAGFKFFTNFKGSTMRRGWVGMKLDHIYSNSLPIVKCGVEKAVTASDHKPVWADIQVMSKSEQE